MPQHDKPDLLTRYFYLESLSSQGVMISLTVGFLGVTIHINLHFVIGICIFFVGAVMLLAELCVACAWMSRGEKDPVGLAKLRRVAVVIRMMSLLVVVALTVWAAAVMIQRSE